MADVLTRFKSGKIWDFKGGIHPPEMKSQSNQSPIQQSELAHDFYVPIKQHAGSAGNVLVKEGDYVLKGQPLTQGDGLRTLPINFWYRKVYRKTCCAPSFGFNRGYDSYSSGWLG
jgi:electron transport complex protein RnfC